jgi:hypothetical protein
MTNYRKLGLGMLGFAALIVASPPIAGQTRERTTSRRETQHHRHHG